MAPVTSEAQRAELHKTILRSELRAQIDSIVADLEGRPV